MEHWFNIEMKYLANLVLEQKNKWIFKIGAVIIGRTCIGITSIFFLWISLACKNTIYMEHWFNIVMRFFFFLENIWRKKVIIACYYIYCNNSKGMVVRGKRNTNIYLYWSKKFTRSLKIIHSHCFIYSFKKNFI